MTNHFDSKGGEQTIAQGENAIGKQDNYYGNISPYLIEERDELMGNKFNNSGDREQNTASGDGAIGKQENIFHVSGRVSVIAALLTGIVIGFIFFAEFIQYAAGPQNVAQPGSTQNVAQPGSTQNVAQPGSTQNVAQPGSTQNVNIYGDISPQRFKELMAKFDVTDSTLSSFFKILEQKEVSKYDLDSKLSEIAQQYKELLARLDSVQSADPQVVQLKKETKQAIEAHDYAKAEKLLEEDVAAKHRTAPAETHVELACLQEMQLRYDKAAEHWERAADLLPKDSEKEQVRYLNTAGKNLERIYERSKALRLYEQSFFISRKILDKTGEDATLDNIREVCDKYSRDDDIIRKDYLDDAEQCLAISYAIGDKTSEGKLLDKIIDTYTTEKDYVSALKIINQRLSIKRKVGDKKEEADTLNTLGMVYRKKGDYGKALSAYKESLAIYRNISDTKGESVSIWNTGKVYEYQDKLTKAEYYINKAVQLEEKIGDPDLESDREYLERLRAKIRGEGWILK